MPRAASVATSGSRRSSTSEFTSSPRSRAVPGMNCHMPAAPTRLYARGL
ncbi:MAG: hypothetical protein OXI12_10670 [Gammaproteobacteria bacterium]|nr:hypothetical protein [Gammaproteobacteria bacterium]